MCLFIIQKKNKRKEKENQYKIRKIKENKIKLLVFKCPITLREVTIKIGLERIDIQEGVTIEMLLISRETGLVMSLEFARK